MAAAAERDAFEGTLRRPGMGGGGSGGPLDVAAELGTGRRPGAGADAEAVGGAGLSGRPREAVDW